MKLHENTKLFKDAIRATSQQMGILDIYIEKDYWVTKALHAIFSNEIGQEVVFKGGTALSKCYRLIERFSEDIDLVTLKKEGESGNQLKNKLKAISQTVNEVMPEVEIEGVTNKKGMIRKTAHDYNKVFDGQYGQVRDKIILESSWLGHYEPYHSREISPYIYDMMLQAEQHQLISEYSMDPFSVQVLDVRRTLCEKILSLVRFSYTERPIEDLKMKIRHLYDLHQLLGNKEISAFVHSDAFADMLQRVGNDDVEGFRNNNTWLNYHPYEALIFAEPDETWKELASTYSKDFKGLVYGSLPAASDVLASLKIVSQRISEIPWNVKAE